MRTVNLTQVRDLIKPGMYIAAGAYCTKRGIPEVDWDIEIWNDNPRGLLLTVSDNGNIYVQFMPEQELKDAWDAAREWRYRLVDPSTWRARPLWKRRDAKAPGRVTREHINKVFAAAFTGEGQAKTLTHKIG
jgi:hypothetical protein